jgi:hypothetical protein
MTNLDVLSNEIHETREAKKTERQVPSSTRTSSHRAAARLSLPPKSAVLRHRRVQCCVVYDCRRGRAPNWKARFVSRRATRPPAHPSAASLARSAHPDSVRGSDSNLWQAGLRRALAGAGPCDPPSPKAGSRPRCRCKVRVLSESSTSALVVCQWGLCQSRCPETYPLSLHSAPGRLGTLNGAGSGPAVTVRAPARTGSQLQTPRRRHHVGEVSPVQVEGFGPLIRRRVAPYW